MLQHIFLDMDGVIAQFVPAAIRVNGHCVEEVQARWPCGFYEVQELLGVSQAEFWHKIDLHGIAFWAGLEPYPWHKELWSLLESFAPVTIASSPSRGGWAATGKVHWLYQHREAGFRAYMLGCDKHLLAAPGRVLVDDSDEKCQEFRRAGGQAIVFPQHWNTRWMYCYDRVGYVRHELEHLAQQLCAACAEP